MRKVWSKTSWNLVVLFSAAIFGIAAISACNYLDANELTISWSTESEVDVAGFNLLRALSRGGPFTKINLKLIPPAKDPFIGGDHSFIDRDVENDLTYFYILETINRMGQATRSDIIELTVGK